jgi:zinc protease
MKKPPISKIIKKFKFPAVEIYECNNFKLFMIEDNTQPMISFKIISNISPLSEHKPGITAFGSSMLTKGTKLRNSEQIAEDTDYIGAKINSFTSWDFTAITIDCLNEFFEKSLEIASDCLLNSVFEDSETEILKGRLIANVMQDNADSEYLASLAFNSTFYKYNHYGHSMNGTQNSLLSITNKELRKWYENLLNNSGFILLVAGNFNKEDMIKLCMKYFAGLIRNPEIKKNYIIYNKINGLEVTAINKPGALQASLRMGRKAISPENKLFPALQLANTIFGGFFLSRLNELLREKLGYTYGISSYINSRKYASSLMINSSLNHDKISDSIKKILEEMQIFSTELSTDEELERAKQFLLGTFLRSSESPKQLLNLLLSIIIKDLPLNYYDEMYNKIPFISKEEIFLTQKKYFKPENLVIAVSGDIEILEKELAKFGIVNIYKENGK